MSFINRIAEFAVADMKKNGILASITIAQAILESASGTSGLTRSANNLFGIKGTGPAGSITLPTKEWSKAKGYYTINAKFRKYNTWLESINDHSQLLLNGVSWNRNIYKPVVEAKDYKVAARALQGTYATDGSYANKLIRLIEQHNLQRFDLDVAEKPAQTDPKQPVSNQKVYTVKAGDNLTKIANAHSVTVNSLVKENNIKDKNLIHPGQKIKIPGKQVSTTVYTVKKGDNLTKIAKQYKTTVSKLVKDNGIKDKNIIQIGQKIKIIE